MPIHTTSDRDSIARIEAASKTLRRIKFMAAPIFVAGLIVLTITHFDATGPAATNPVAESPSPKLMSPTPTQNAVEDPARDGEQVEVNNGPRTANATLLALGSLVVVSGWVMQADCSTKMPRAATRPGQSPSHAPYPELYLRNS